MSKVINSPTRTRLEDVFFYEVKSVNGLMTAYAYPIFDKDITSRANLDIQNSVHQKIWDTADFDEETHEEISDMAIMSEGAVADFGYSGNYLWDESEDVIEKLGIQLKEKGLI